MGAAFIVGMFYCLDALHGERRDRSILFWKSLPVSDLTTVLSKASIPLVILPLLAFAITVVTQWIMLLLSSLVLAGSGPSAGDAMEQLPLFQMSVMLLYHLVTVHVLWYAPIYAWFLLVSGWARRAAFCGPCCRRWPSASSRKLPSIHRILPPGWGAALSAERTVPTTQQPACRWIRWPSSIWADS